MQSNFTKDNEGMTQLGELIRSGAKISNLINNGSNGNGEPKITVSYE